MFSGNWKGGGRVYGVNKKDLNVISTSGLIGLRRAVKGNYRKYEKSLLGIHMSIWEKQK